MTQSAISVSETTSETPPKQKLTFEEYRFYQPESDEKYELYKGELIIMPNPTILHTQICEFLVYKLQRYLASANVNLVTKTDVGKRTQLDSSRIPDVMVCTESLLKKAAERKGSGILSLEETPELVIEVVSENSREDYVLKRAEYEQVGVPEYWIVDPRPQKKRVRVFSFPDGEDSYENTDFTLGEAIQSIRFPNLVLSVDEVLEPPVVDGLIRLEQSQLQELEKQVEKLAAKLRELNIDPDRIS